MPDEAFPSAVPRRPQGEGLPHARIASEVHGAEQRQVIGIRVLGQVPGSDQVFDEHGHPFHPLDGASQQRVVDRLLVRFEAPLGQADLAAGARKLIPHSDRVNVRVHRLVEEDHLPTALGAGHHFRPDDVIDQPSSLFAQVQERARLAVRGGAIEVTALGVRPVDQGLGIVEKGEHIHPDVVVVSDESGSRAQVVQDGDATAPLDTRHLLLDGGFLIGRQVFAEGRRHARHPGAAESIENEVTRAGVVEDVPEDGLMRDLRVVAVGHVDRVVLARSHVEGERLAMIGLLRAVGPAVMGDHILEERVRAGGEVWRVGEGEDVLDLAKGNPSPCRKFGSSRCWRSRSRK